MFYPRGAKLELDLASLSPIQGQTAYTLYAQFKGAMEHDEFDARVDAEGQIDAMVLRFRRIGQTAGYAGFGSGPPEEEPDKLDAVLALLGRLDEDEDEAVLVKLQSNPNLAGIAEADWEQLRREREPVAAAFFTSEAALNTPLLHGLMSLAGAAFFDRLGLLD
jgi:hypothetical protein